MSLQVQRLDELIRDETIEGRLSAFFHFLWCYIFRFKINICKVKLHVGKIYGLNKKKKTCLCGEEKQNDIKLTLLEKEQIHGLIPAGQSRRCNEHEVNMSTICFDSTILRPTSTLDLLCKNCNPFLKKQYPHFRRQKVIEIA